MAKSRASYDHNLFTVSIVKLNLRKSTRRIVVARVDAGRTNANETSSICIYRNAHPRARSASDSSPVSSFQHLCVCVWVRVCCFVACHELCLAAAQKTSKYRFCFSDLVLPLPLFAQIAILSRTWFNSIFNYPQRTTGKSSVGGTGVKWLTKQSRCFRWFSLWKT